MELRNYTDLPAQGTRVFGGGGKYSNKDNTYHGHLYYDLDPNSSVNPDNLTNVDVSQSINAIEIDWNGYNTGTKIIHNTGDFLDWIEEETNKVRPSFNQETHYQPSSYNGSITKRNISINVPSGSTNIPVDEYGHLLIDGLSNEFGYLYIGDGECSNDSDHTTHNHINRYNFDQIADIYYYPAYINTGFNVMGHQVDKNHQYGDDDSSTVYIVIKEGFKPKDHFNIKINGWNYSGELKPFDTFAGYNFFKIDDIEDGTTIQLQLLSDAPLR